MSIDLTRLAELAAKATPGPWIADPDDVALVVAPCPCCGPIATCHVFGPPGSTSRNCYNTDFIAACSPDIIAGLVAELRAARELANVVRLFEGEVSVTLDSALAAYDTAKEQP